MLYKWNWEYELHGDESNKEYSFFLSKNKFINKNSTEIKTVNNTKNKKEEDTRTNEISINWLIEPFAIQDVL